MPRFPIAGVLAVMCSALVACSGSTPAVTATPQPTNISGDYAGTMQDAQGGSGTATATFAQHGANAGGAITDTETAATITAQVSFTISSTNALKGTIVVDYPNNGPTCTFSTTGTYNTSTNVITGSYTAVTNCSGDTGTYSLTQQCTDTVTNHARRYTGGLLAC